MSVVRACRIHKRERASNMLVLKLKRILRAKWLMQRVEYLVAMHVAGGRTYPPCSPGDGVGGVGDCGEDKIHFKNPTWPVFRGMNCGSRCIKPVKVQDRGPMLEICRASASTLEAIVTHLKRVANVNN